jgi:hypothetical protein
VVKEENSSSPFPLSDLALVLESVLGVEEVLAWQEAQARIPSWLRGNTFFSERDFWVFTAVMDDRTCFHCNILDKVLFTGLELRLAFPYLEIIDVKTVLARVHPHCRCILTRVTNPLDLARLDVYLPVEVMT